jgi:hypothetical protein
MSSTTLTSLGHLQPPYVGSRVSLQRGMIPIQGDRPTSDVVTRDPYFGLSTGAVCTPRPDKESPSANNRDQLLNVVKVGVPPVNNVGSSTGETRLKAS